MGQYLDKLAFILTGMENSGTTCTAELMKQKMLGVNGGFELGILLVESPRQFPTADIPFYQKMIEGRPKKRDHGRGWGISHHDLNHCCDTDSFPEFYKRLSDCWCPGEMIVDKAPGYVYYFRDMLERSQDGPVIVAHKHIYWQWASFKRRGVPMDMFKVHYDRWVQPMIDCSKEFSDRVRLIDHFDFVKDKEGVTDQAIEFINTFGVEYGRATGKPEHPLTRGVFEYSYNIDELVPMNEKLHLDSIAFDPTGYYESIRA